MIGKGSTFFMATVFVICHSITGTSDAHSNSEVLLFTLPSGMDFVTIPEGSFVMGSPSSEYRRGEDEKQHRVNISAFELMTTEVTQGMWRKIMDDNPAFGNGEGNEYPVYYVSWNDCQIFIEKLNDFDSNYTYRLPTEAEWEYACRAGTTTRNYWGESSLNSMRDQYCNSTSSTEPVGQKIPNAWGIYDMVGNVWEFCQDVYTDDYDNCPNDGSAYTGSGSRRIIRGCSHRSYNCRSANRNRISPSYRLPIVGFRLVRSPK